MIFFLNSGKEYQSSHKTSSVEFYKCYISFEVNNVQQIVLKGVIESHLKKYIIACSKLHLLSCILCSQNVKQMRHFIDCINNKNSSTNENIG